MPVHIGYDSNKKEEPKCYARWGRTGKKYYYTCNNESARDKAKSKAAAQGRAIIAGGWQEKIKKIMKGVENMTEKNRNIEGSYEEKMGKLRAHFDEEDTYIVYTFQDAVIIKDYVKGIFYEIEYSIVDDKIKSGKKKEVEVTYIQKRLLEEAKDHVEDKGMNEALKVYLHYNEKGEYPGEEGKKEEDKSVELTGPIFKKTEKQRIVYAAVLVPGEPDLDADKGEKILTEEEVEQVAHKWMEEYGNIDYMHGLNNVAKPVESFILPMDYEVEAYGEKINLPKGTWVLAAKVVNDKAWKEVEEGKLTGFSIMGIQNNVLKSIMDSVSKGKRVDKELNAAMKRVLIKDLGKNWIVPFVSLVDNACVPKSKFFAIKQKDKDTNNNEGGVWDRIINIFKRNDVEKAGRSISNSTFTKLKNALEALQILIDKADKERRPKIINSKMKGDELDMEEKDVIKLIDEKLEEKLKPIDEGLKALLPKEEEDEKTEKTEEKKDEEKETKKGEETEEKKDEEKETLKAENITLKETLEKLVAEKKKIEDAKKAKSKAEKGQEDGEEKKTYTTKDHLDDLGRDSMGRPVNKEKK